MYGYPPCIMYHFAQFIAIKIEQKHAQNTNLTDEIGQQNAPSTFINVSIEIFLSISRL